jgi:ATP-dependent Clp protease adapter protein ClpS
MQDLYSMGADVQELEAPEVGTTSGVTFPSKVILFNDEWHTFEEVINQIVKATACSMDRAENLTLEVHNTGKACVYEGDMNDCLQVSSILEEISLHTQIEY